MRDDPFGSGRDPPGTPGSSSSFNGKRRSGGRNPGSGRIKAVCFPCAVAGRMGASSTGPGKTNQAKSGPSALTPPSQARLWLRGLAVQSRLVAQRIPHLAATDSGSGRVGANLVPIWSLAPRTEGPASSSELHRIRDEAVLSAG